jgi:stearoyl-CoA desaturase (delta-9 desaturase)
LETLSPSQRNQFHPRDFINTGKAPPSFKLTTIMAKSEPSEKLHISEKPVTFSNWYQHVNWVNTTLILIVPVGGVVAAFYTQLRAITATWAILYYFWTGLGITAGYHRLWAHRSYEA